MTLEELKEIISQGSYQGQLIIFQYRENKFIPFQYINKLKQDTQLEVRYSTELDNLLKTPVDIFGNNCFSSVLRIYDVDTFDTEIFDLDNEKNLLIICKKVSDKVRSYYKDNIVFIPTLESWQIKDFVYSLADGVRTQDLDKLIDLCGNNIYRINSELDKLLLFPSSMRQSIFNRFIEDGVFNDLSDSTIFDLCESLLKKDTKKLQHVYSQINQMDVNPLGLISLLYQNIKNIIKIQLSKNPTPTSTDIPNNRFYAIKFNYLGVFNQTELIALFKMISGIEKKIKLGIVDVDNVIDYIIVYVFSVRG